MKTADKFFNNVDFVSIVDTIKGIFTSDGSMATLLDFERVLDEADLYAYKNWEIGELVQGPVVKRYTVACIFMYPEKLMPNPKGALRLTHLGCHVKFKKTKMEVPIEVKSYDDYMPGTRYPKSVKRSIWLVYIEMPKYLMDEIREGSIDLAGQQIDLNELDDAYDQDLDQDGKENEQQMQAEMGGLGGLPPPPAQAPALGGPQPPAM
jgi:hypothetical protein